MFKITNLLAFAAILVSGAAEASTFSCTSVLLNYNFSLTGKIQGNKVIGSAMIDVTEGSKPLRRAAFPVVTSQFTPSQALQINAADAHSKIVVDAHFLNGAYVGPMTINSDEGDVNLNASCSVK